MEVRLRALAGSKIVLLRGIVVRGVVFVGGLMLARMLDPRDFGTAAVGLTVLAFGTLLADGGLGAALIRRTEPPNRRELATLLGWQLLLTFVFIGLGSLVAPNFGRTGMVSLVMSMALPFAALQVPGAITLERSLRYGPRVIVELVEASAWLCSGVLLVMLGAGVWGLAIASVVRSAAGAATMLALVPVRLFPLLSWSSVRGLLGFGTRFQAVSATNLIRDQGVNLLVLAVGGLHALGLWSLTYRIMQLPFVLLESLWRVSYPAMARLLESGGDPQPVVRRVIEIVSIANGFILVVLGATSPQLVPVLFGDRWQEAAAIIPPSCAGLLLAGGVSVAGAGLLYARGRTRTILLTAALHTVAWLCGTAALWPWLGTSAIGWGWFLSGVVELIGIGGALRDVVNVPVLRLLLPSLTAALLAGSVGYFLAVSMETGVLGLLSSAVTSAAVYLVVVKMVAPGSVAWLVQLARETR